MMLNDIANSASAERAPVSGAVPCGAQAALLARMRLPKR